MDSTMNPSQQEAPSANASHQRTTSFSQQSDVSETAQDFITNQLRLEVDARETLPYRFDTCTRSLGSIRQSLYSCLTCNPPPSDLSQPYKAAGICYSCSISCHGEHTLVELFTRREFSCDCGTTRLPSTSTCSLRTNESTGTKGDVHSEAACATNTYNHNFQNRFCGCGEEYDPHAEKGTMFQCMGLATESEGGCGEDWWHPECLMGLDRDWYSKHGEETIQADPGILETVKEESEPSEEPQTNGVIHNGEAATDLTTSIDEPTDSNDLQDETMVAEDDGHPVPPGFPAEEDFEHFICYKCTSVHPWIKRYAGTPGFLAAVSYNSVQNTSGLNSGAPETTDSKETATPPTLKRKAETDDNEDLADIKRVKSGDLSVPTQAAVPSSSTSPSTTTIQCTYTTLPPTPPQPLSLFLTPTFRSHLCHCPTHFPLLPPHPYLLTEEEAYEPPLSTPSSPAGQSVNGDDETSSQRSLLDRGEAALGTMDRIKAIEGVMAYNRLKDKVKEFLRPFAESGTPVGAEDVKAYFEKLRGDDEAIRHARREGGG